MYWGRIMSEWREYKLVDAPFEIIDGDRGTNYPKQMNLSKWILPFPKCKECNNRWICL